MTRLWPLALLLWPALAGAHEFRPARLDVKALDAGRHAVTWTVETDAAGGDRLRPVLLPDCREEGPPQIAEAGARTVERWVVTCGQDGPARLGVRGPALAAGIETFFRFTRSDGVVLTGLLDGRDPVADLRAASASGAFGRYVVLGVEHILLGVDHLLFVLGLVLLIRGRGRLLGAITGFTVGHSVTLALAALALVKLPPAPVEAAIALSILLLAWELTRGERDTPMRRAPWLVAALFGLLHGFGFAGVLSELGLPEGAVAPALAGFNVGVELGQVAFVAVLLAVGAVAGRRVPRERWTTVGAYGLGVVATYWTIERVAAFWG